MKKINQPILVTGSHRSGTTWVGKNLALAPNTAYIHEPFNLHVTLPSQKALMHEWFQFIDSDNESLFYDSLHDVLELRYPFMDNLKRSRTLKNIAQNIINQASASYHQLNNSRPIMKDPIAFFSSSWLSKTFSMRVLITIRHPAAFCSSLKLKNWQFDFRNFLNQPRLMETFLSNYEPQIRDFVATEKPIIDQAILLWNCIHSTIARYQEMHPEWIYVRHEDLSLDPLAAFNSIFKQLDLEFSDKVKTGIIENSGSHNPKERSAHNEFKRNSKANVFNWKHRLHHEEIKKILHETEEFRRRFYPEDIYQ